MTVTPALDTLSTTAVSLTHQQITPYLSRTPVLHSKQTATLQAHLKCENLQITDSFKVRGAFGALLSYRDQQSAVWERITREGVVACSSGNFAQGLAYATAELGIGCSVVVPETITDAKRRRIRHYNPAARIVDVPYAQWRQTITTSRYPALPGFFISSQTDPYVSLGVATVGLEILQDLPETDAVLVPYGGGNLAYSIASLLRAAGHPAPVYAVELSTGAPLTASLRAGRPVDVSYAPSFVDGIGATFVIPAQFHRVREVLAGALTVTPEQTAATLASLAFTDKIICEGAGAAAFAALLAYAPTYGWKKPCAVISGAVIDPAVLLNTLATGHGRTAG